jgi:hypothetical protein
MNIIYDEEKQCIEIDGREFYSLRSIPENISDEIDSITWFNFVLFFSHTDYPD